MVKTSFSALGEPKFREELKKCRPKSVILTGIETHVCVLQTALELLNEGFEVQVLADGVGSRERLNWAIGLEQMEKAGAVISSTEILAFALLKKAGTPEFKAVSQFIK